MASANVVRKIKHGKPQRSDEFDCTLCLKLLYEPITTPCGHSFCCSCLFQSMDHGKHLHSSSFRVSYLFLSLTYANAFQVTNVLCAEQCFSLVPKHIQQGIVSILLLQSWNVSDINIEVMFSVNCALCSRGRNWFAYYHNYIELHSSMRLEFYA